MASNVAITPGSGDVVAAEDVSSVKYQLVKLVDSTSTSTTRTGVAANPIQVSLANTATNATAIKTDGSAVTQPVSAASLPLPTGAATAAKQPALGTAGTPSSDVITVQGAIGVTPLSVVAQGTVAHDAADANSPVKIGAKAKAALSGVTLVSADDRTDLFADLDGVLITRLNSAIGDYIGGGAAITDGSSTSVISAPGAGIKIYITDVIIANSSSTNVTVDIRDGTAGSVKGTFPVPANGGVVHRFSTPIGFTANTAVAADPSAAASTISVSLSGFKSKI